jgi:hypothetical protein
MTLFTAGESQELHRLTGYREAVDAQGRVDRVAATKRYREQVQAADGEYDVGEELGRLVRRGLLHVTSHDGTTWFDPAELDAARPHLCRGPGRPTTGVVVESRIPRTHLSVINDLADAAGVSRSQVIRDLIGEALAARGCTTTGTP